MLFLFFNYTSGLQTWFFFFSSRRRHTSSTRDWSSDVCSSDLRGPRPLLRWPVERDPLGQELLVVRPEIARPEHEPPQGAGGHRLEPGDQRQRGGASLGGDLDPPDPRDGVVLAPELEPELVDVERLGPLLVGYGNRDHDHVLDCHLSTSS